jgi:hypothetical protein
VPASITRYRPSRQFVWAGLVAVAIAAFSCWVALRWEYAWIAAGLAFASAFVSFLMGFAPTIEIFDSHLKFGSRSIPWGQIRRLDRATLVPLLVRLTLADNRTTLLFYAGDPESTNSLLRSLRRMAHEALIDGVPYKQFWGEPAGSLDRKQLPPPPRYPLLLPDDEAEVERLFQRLRIVGNLDQAGSTPKASTPKTSTPKISEEDK